MRWPLPRFAPIAVIYFSHRFALRDSLPGPKRTFRNCGLMSSFRGKATLTNRHPDVAEKSFAVLKPGGRAAFIASGMEAPKPNRSDVTALRPPVPRSRAAMEREARTQKEAKVRF
jgi:hypothetical protein